MLEQPGESDLVGCGVVVVGHLVEPVEVARAERCPRDEADVVLLAVVEDCLVLAIADVVLVLDGGDLDYVAGRFELLDRDIRDTDVVDLPRP